MNKGQIAGRTAGHIYKFFRKYGYGIFLGVTLNEFADLNPSDWQLYIILVPVIILINWGYETRQ